jgi:hypothetical protein
MDIWGFVFETATQLGPCGLLHHLGSGGCCVLPLCSSLLSPEQSHTKLEGSCEVPSHSPCCHPVFCRHSVFSKRKHF